MDWQECCRKRITKDVQVDEAMITALQKASKNKLESSQQLPLNLTTAASKLSLAYESLRELLEALALQRGYKIYNHECYTAFLKEIVQESYWGDEFDELRKARNAVNYYGKDISPEEAKELLSKIKTLRTKIKSLFKSY
ncbi:MAG: hypothetical protein KJ597_01815 [Nanoarchaeota archaeon]|nr:hypothetical protein [Nanoarchaeota archaeon]MBU1622287.1 hypothetical protein [Nanoarchaeota archaeon]